MKTRLFKPAIVTRKGKPVSIILPISHYEELLERVEDTEDVAWLKHARRRPLRYRPVEDYLASVLRLMLVLVTVFGVFAKSRAQSNTPEAIAQDNLATPSFAQVVNQYFSQWDSNADGVLSKDEIDAAVANPKFHDEAAAAIGIIRMVVHGGKYTLPPITKDYLVSSSLHEPSVSDEQIALQDDPSKSEKFDHAPAFQPRYLAALNRLHQASHELFPQKLPSLDAMHQAGLGDCSFLSTVGTMVYRNPSAVKAMFTQNDDGSITVAFGDGQRAKVERVTDADMVICSTAGSNGLWLTILEKAYRKTLLKQQSGQQEKQDVYDRMNGPAMEILDGQQTREVRLRNRRGDSELAVAIQKDLNAAQREHRLVKAGTPEVKETPGITTGHAYAILGYDNKTGLVHVWNPHSNNFIPKGPEGLQNGYTTKAGQFEIPLKDLLQIYANVTIETKNPDR